MIYRTPPRVLLKQLDVGDLQILEAFDRRYGLPDAWDLQAARAVIGIYNGFAKRGQELKYPVKQRRGTPMAIAAAKAALKAQAERHARLSTP